MYFCSRNREHHFSVSNPRFLVFSVENRKMPLSLGCDPKDLQIELASPPGWHNTAGDTVIGHVTRSAPIVSPDACVRLSLVGRLKTKIYRESSVLKGSQKFRSLGHLWTPKPQILFRGPLHLPKSKKCYPIYFLGLSNYYSHVPRFVGFR
jgi:hypothetical protein